MTARRLRCAVALLLVAGGGCAVVTARRAKSPWLELVFRVPGKARNGELGFRFGPPRDVDGDGFADLAGGARGTELEFTQMGTVRVWSGRERCELAYWEGTARDALFGQAVVIGPDGDGDGLPDVVASAPNGSYRGENRGIVYARSVLTGRLLWQASGGLDESFGWHLELAGDQNHDGSEDLFVATPEGGAPGKVVLLSGRDGSTLREYASREKRDQFGWHVSAVPDVDGDGRDDLVAGAPTAADARGEEVGAAYLFSTATGKPLQRWEGRSAEGMFGEMVAGLADLDGDGAGEVAVAAPHRASKPVEEWLPGEVSVYSGATGARLFHWRGRHNGERFGRMIRRAGDADGDGVGDIALGVPWSRNGSFERAGRVELRSGRTGELLASVEGHRTDMWLGWHIEPAAALGAQHEPGLVVSALRSAEDGLEGAGALLFYAFR